MLCWNGLFWRIAQNLNQLLTVSCLLQTRCCMYSVSFLFVMCLGHLIWRGHSPMYPSSASTLSFSDKWLISESRKIVMSLYFPQGYGPLIHTMSPVFMQMHTSYRSPLLLNLWLYQYFLRSGMRKSVPSTVTKQSSPVSPLKRFSHIICESNKRKRH